MKIHLAGRPLDNDRQLNVRPVTSASVKNVANVA
jgi:hypothetical protein